MSLSTIDSREWNKLFPADISTQSDSALLIHRLFTATLSALTAKRQIFSNDHFSSKKFGPLFVPLFFSLDQHQLLNKSDLIQRFFHGYSNNLSNANNHFFHYLNSRYITSSIQWRREEVKAGGGYFENMKFFVSPRTF